LVKASVCTNCSAGQYSAAAAPVCSDCSAGTFAVAEGSVSCSNCSAGTFSLVKAAECTECLAGQFSAEAAPTCSNCSAGSFAKEEGSAACTLCSAGTATNDTESTSCVPCKQGDYAAGEGNALCSACAGGTYSNTQGAAVCTNCSAGSFQDKTGQVSCALCPKGSFQATEASTVCDTCPQPSRTFTTYREGSVSDTECYGPLLTSDSFKVYNTTQRSIGEGVKLTAVQGDWLVKAHFDETEAFVLKQGESRKPHIKAVVTLSPIMPNKFCYKATEGNGQMYSGYRDTDASGTPCDEGFLCRNADGEGVSPFCLVNGIASSCGVPKCVWDVQCFTGIGADYRGEAAKTSAGYTCQNWDKDWPHYSYYKPTPHNKELYGIGADNFCRNPDPRNADSLWCYTTSLWKRSDECSVKQCDATVPYFDNS